ncbi:hypothetical protein D3C79_949570 [compost metagenome]
MTPITAYAMGSVSVTMIAHASPMTITIRSLASSTGGVMLIAIMTVSQGIHASFWTLTAIAAAGLGLSLSVKEQPLEQLGGAR